MSAIVDERIDDAPNSLQIPMAPHPQRFDADNSRAGIQC
jgi:hypothetical protein